MHLEFGTEGKCFSALFIMKLFFEKNKHIKKKADEINPALKLASDYYQGEFL